MCFLPAGRIAVNGFSGLVYIVYGAGSQNAIWCASLNRARRAERGVQREDWEKANEFLFLPLSICFWGEQKSQGEHTQDAVWLAQSYH